MMGIKKLIKEVRSLKRMEEKESTDHIYIKLEGIKQTVESVDQYLKGCKCYIHLKHYPDWQKLKELLGVK